jgi:hypothetical protein
VTALVILVWNLAAWVAWMVALVRVARTPAGQFLHGRWSKAGRLLLTVSVSLTIAHVFLPLGAFCMLIALRPPKRPEQPLDWAEPRGPQLPE